MKMGTVKWVNIVIGFNIVTSQSKFLTVHNSLSNELIRLIKSRGGDDITQRWSNIVILTN
jgi:hypothetical protein